MNGKLLPAEPTGPMTYTEARACVDAINASVGDIRYLLLDLYEREGWLALGYDSWRECAVSEFLYSQPRVYQLLEAAKAERNISTIVEKPLREGVLRPLTRLKEPEQQRVAWQRAVDAAPNGQPTAAQVEAIVRQLGADTDDDQPETISEKELVATAKGFRLCYLLTVKGAMTIEQIASELEITLRHVYRVIAKCELAGPLAEDGEGRFFLSIDANDWL